MTPFDVDTETKGRCAKCGYMTVRDAYAPCNLHPDVAHPCGGACHAVYDCVHGIPEFKGFCGPIVFAVPTAALDEGSTR